MSAFLALIIAAGQFSTVLMFGTLGEILTEKSGNLNLGVEGIMYMGGAFGLWGAFSYQQAVGDAAAKGPAAILIALLCAFLAGAVASLIFSFITVTLRANQNVTGLALTIFGTGVGQFTGEFMRVRVGGYVALNNTLKAAFVAPIFPEALRNIPGIGKLLFGQTVFLYIALALAVAMHLFFVKTKRGLYLRAVGESPSTADSAGIDIVRYKYAATVVGGGISAIGGMVYIMTTAGCVWNHEGLSGVGWLAVALVIFCMWRPLNAIWGSILFGVLMIMYLRVKIAFIPTEIYKILPYVVTVVVLIITSLRKDRETQAPASLGLNYFREDR